jgi:hypothetical protein
MNDKPLIGSISSYRKTDSWSCTCRTSSAVQGTNYGIEGSRPGIDKENIVLGFQAEARVEG